MSAIIGGVGGAIVGSAIIGAGAGLAGAAISSSGAKDAAQTQAGAAAYAADLQHQQYEEQRADQQPWRDAGTTALGQMQDPYFQKGFSMADFQADPGYQFRMQEGQKAIERSAAARGGLQSGGTLKALTDYAQGMGSQEYQNAYNRFTNDQSNRYNRLASLAGLGQTANGQLGQAGMNYANNAGESYMGAGNAAAGAQMATGQTWGNTLSSLGSGIGNMGMQYGMMKGLYGQPGGGTTTSQPWSPGAGQVVTPLATLPASNIDILG